MSTAPATITLDAQMRGIQNTLTGCVIESESINESDVTEQVPDQNGAIAGEISYDKRTDLKLTVRKSAVSGTIPATVGSDLTYPATGNSAKKYRVDSVEEAGTYSGLRRWNITAHRYNNWPT